MFHITADSKRHSYFTVSNTKLQGNEKGENGSERELKMLHDQFIMENFEDRDILQRKQTKRKHRSVTVNRLQCAV